MIVEIRPQEKAIPAAHEIAHEMFSAIKKPPENRGF